jgi:hypothetical protein
MRIRRWTTVGLTALLAVPALSIAAAAPSQAATGPYGGNASGDLVHIQAVNAPGIEPGVADAHVALSNAQVNSSGLAAPAGKRSYARATNVDAPLLAGNVPLTGLVVEADQSAPPTNAAAKEASLTGPLDLSPIASLEAAKASAHAVWGATDTTCIAPGQPIATATSTVLDAGVLSLGDPIGDAVVSVVNGQGGAAFSNSNVGLVNVANQTNKGLKSTALDQLTGIVLFKGSANEITINVSAPPTISAIATGTAATSSVTYDTPTLEIIQGGQENKILDVSNPGTDITIPGVILHLALGTLNNVKKTDTEASGDTALLHIDVFDIVDTLTPLARVEIAPMAVKATVPAGGVTCPDAGAGVQVDASTPTVFPGSTFEYAITIPNAQACTLDTAKVVFTVTGPAGTAITGTSPTADNVTGLTATWNNVGPIAPGALKTLKATVKVPTNAPPGATFVGSATVTGTCGGAPVSNTGTSGPVPSVGAPSATACDLTASSISSSHREVRIGDMFNDYVRVTNLGRGTCNAITVTLPYPPDTSFVACTDSCTHDDTKRVVTWTIPSLGSGISKDLAATFKVDPSAKAGESLGTTVTIKSGNRTVTDKTTLPTVTAANVLNAGAQRARGILPRTGADLPTGLALSLLGAFLAVRGWRRRTA